MVLLKILQNSLENACVGVKFLRTSYVVASQNFSNQWEILDIARNGCLTIPFYFLSVTFDKVCSMNKYTCWAMHRYQTKIRIKNYRICSNKGPRRLFISELEGAAPIGGLRLKEVGTYFKVYSYFKTLQFSLYNYHCDIWLYIFHNFYLFNFFIVYILILHVF